MGSEIEMKAQRDQQQSTAIETVEGEREFFAELDRRDKLFGRILNYAIAATHPTQWTDLGGKPWPTGPAAEAMARRCRVSWVEVESEREDYSDALGDYYSYTYRARFILGEHDEITAEGHCSSRDAFLGTGTEQGEDATRQPWEVEPGVIKQAAYTNMVVNGVTRLLGVRNLSWERLSALLGVKREDFAKAKFEAGARGGGRGKTESEKPIPFGRAKGKNISDPSVSDEDLGWLLGKMKEPASDPKYQASNDAWVKRIEAELARRANAKAGVSPSGNGGGAAPSIWQRIQALPEAKGVAKEDLTEVVKEATGKEKAGALDEADVAKVQAALKAWREKTGKDSDIRF
jgi:hypothetical protein